MDCVCRSDEEVNVWETLFGSDSLEHQKLDGRMTLKMILSCADGK
jgi:hypothetical protein